MANKSLNSYLDILEEFLNDDEKIVTYKYISKSLGIHINVAKQLLDTYFSKHKHINSIPICATYLLAGKVANGDLNVTIVNDSDLEDASSKFIEITSCHVYSIQKGKCLKDIQILAGISPEICENERKYVIQCSKSVPKSHINKDDYSDTNKTLQNFEKLKTDISGTSAKEPPKEDIIKNVAKSPKKTSPNNSLKVEKKQASLKGNKPSGNITNFFANAGQKSSSKYQKNLENETKISEKKENNSISEISGVKEIKISYDENKIGTSSAMKNSGKKSERAKRKRIQFLPDSDDSDDSFEEQPIEENIEPEFCINSLEDEKKTDITSSEMTSVFQNKRKKRKIVDVTIMNEDGYLETRKEFSFATDSEDEIEQKQPALLAKDIISKTSVPEIKNKDNHTSNAPKKQASLFSFFKKN